MPGFYLVTDERAVSLLPPSLIVPHVLDGSGEVATDSLVGVEGSRIRYFDSKPKEVGLPWPMKPMTSVYIRIDAWDLPGVHASDYLVPAGEILISLLQNQAIVGGVLEVVQEEPRVFATWDDSGVVLESHTPTSSFDHRELWDYVPAELERLAIPYRVDTDPVDPGSMVFGDSLFQRSADRYRVGVTSADRWLVVPDRPAAEAVRAEFDQEGPERGMSWRKAFETGAIEGAAAVDRIEILLGTERLPLYER